MSIRSYTVGIAAALIATLMLALAGVPAFADVGEAHPMASASDLVAGQADGISGTQPVETCCIEEVNPIYADKLDAQDLFGQEQASGTSGRAEAKSSRKTASDQVFSSQEEASAAIREALLAQDATIKVTLETDSGYAQYGFPMFYAALVEPDEASSDEYILMVDYLRYNYLGARCVCTGTHVGEAYTITYTYTITYSASKAQGEQLFNDVQQQVASFGFTEDTSDVQKFRTIYDFVCEQVVYDYAHLEYDGYLLMYSAYAAFENGTAICQGYSQLLDLMCGYAGISARIIAGKGGNEEHAWNIVGLGQADGSILYYDVDSTWDSIRCHEGRAYGYYLLSDGDFSKHERGSWGKTLSFASDEFYAAHPMAENSYVPPVCTIDGVAYSLVGDEAVASVYVSSDVTAIKLAIPENIDVDGQRYEVTEIGEDFLGSSEAAQAVKTVVLPSTVKTIRSRAFQGSRVAEVHLPDGLLRIDEQAFAGCSDLAAATLPKSLVLVGKRAFDGCDGLETAKVLGAAMICEGAFTGLKASIAADGSVERASTLFVSTPCQKRMIENGGDTFITQSRTRLILAEGASDEPGHKLLHVETCPSTCESAGFVEYWKCLACGKEYVDEACATELTEREAIEPVGHDWDAGKTTVKPTETTEGERTYTCLRCWEKRTETTPVVVWELKETALATCDEAGYRLFQSNYGDERRDPIAPLGHDYRSAVTEPTCTKGGYTTHTCSRCGDSYADAKTAALGHEWGAGEVTAAATYTAKGARTFTCARCKATRTEAIAMLPKLGQAIAPAKKAYAVKFSKVKKKAQKVAVKFKASGGGKVTYKAAKTAGGKVKIAKNGKVTVAKGTKKGVYTLKVKVTAAAKGKYAKTVRTVKLKILVK